ncbi:MAG: DUF1007 family protein [Geminicoccaceae bacterium]
MIWRILILAILIASGMPSAEAHPHAWIDLRSKVLLDDAGRVRALQLDWIFDDYYTVAIADEVDVGSQISDEFWTEIAGKNLSNLADHHYFTVIKADDAAVELGDVSRYEGGLRDGRMWMSFEVPLAEPIDPRSNAVSYAIYDPTYYIEIVHLEDDVITFEGEGGERCAGDIVQPNPTLEQVSLAAALDQNESAGEGLGELFAETVVVRCS